MGAAGLEKWREVSAVGPLLSPGCQGGPALAPRRPAPPGGARGRARFGGAWGGKAGAPGPALPTQPLPALLLAPYGPHPAQTAPDGTARTRPLRGRPPVPRGTPGPACANPAPSPARPVGECAPGLGTRPGSYRGHCGCPFPPTPGCHRAPHVPGLPLAHPQATFAAALGCPQAPCLAPGSLLACAFLGCPVKEPNTSDGQLPWFQTLSSLEGPGRGFQQGPEPPVLPGGVLPSWERLPSPRHSPRRPSSCQAQPSSPRNAAKSLTHVVSSGFSGQLPSIPSIYLHWPEKRLTQTPQIGDSRPGPAGQPRAGRGRTGGGQLGAGGSWFLSHIHRGWWL